MCEIREILKGGKLQSWTITLMLGALSGCGVPSALEALKQAVAEVAEFEHHGAQVRVEFYGEVPSTELFGNAIGLPLQPIAEDGGLEGVLIDLSPSWLRFTYWIGSKQRTVLVAKRPLMTHISWDAIARAGAALGNDALIVVSGVPHAQNARVRAADGSVYRVRLPRCGQSTMAHLSEWNLLIRGVHGGDPDFAGNRYGWLNEPFTDEDLMVGFGGSLTWCQDVWRSEPGYRVVRGYFHVSRFHAAPSHIRTDRIVWRPVLELVDSGESYGSRLGGTPAQAAEISPHQDVTYFGLLDHEELFDGGWRITDAVPLDMGVYVKDGRPSWLHFEMEGKALFVAATPVKHSLSWNAIAQAGAALGDGSIVRLAGASHVQRAEVSDAHGNRYRVRLLTCGTSTMDPDSEWNRLIGGIHIGDGDFVANADGRFGWAERALMDVDLHTGEREGAATWCQDRRVLHGREYAVNRGYLTVSRFHLTETTFRGYGFGWRPVLERVESR